MKLVRRRDVVAGFAAAASSWPALAQSPRTRTSNSARERAQNPPPPEPPSPKRERFNPDDVKQRAQDLAASPFDERAPELPPELANLDYDAQRDIRFRREKAFLSDHGGRFRLELFHRGPLARRDVAMNVVRDGVAERIEYDPNLFDYGRNRFPTPLPRHLGFAGLRLLYPLNRPDTLDELIVFLGASYFRFLGRNQRYGLSARTLAINSGGVPEEFPFFREFWIVDPGPEDDAITLHALLDSASTTGACTFLVRPGEESPIDVEVALFPRKPIERLGIAPLTSMFYAGEADLRVKDEFRPEIHDSDGLLVHAGTGEWLWRPLRNPSQVSMSSFLGENVRGFGLMQRDRVWSRYTDIEAAYEQRPSYWVEPKGDWGKGRVELVELTAEEETVDNIVAFWTPAEQLTPDKPHTFAYRLRSMIDNFRLQGGGVAQNTFLKPLPDAGGRRRRQYLVDFARGDLSFWLKDPARVEIVPTVSAGTVEAHEIVPNPHTQGFRATIQVAAEPGTTVELRMFLRAGTHALTETWTTTWSA